ncbi:MAG: hypothetical protein V2I27_04565 [Erythrobacter sp.]|nr:hypothetical protein [Erythrobacter sp.]
MTKATCTAKGPDLAEAGPSAMDEAAFRAARRRTLMLRSAKVVCASGEYVCIVRDVCEIGTTLSFLHDVPPDDRMILALGNGLTYPVERVWSGKRQAGYRFGAQVIMDEFLHERAPFELRPIRLAILAPAYLIDGRERHAVQLLNVSTHGALFESAHEHALLRLFGFQISGMPQYLGQVCWREGHQHGLRFQHPLALQELAELALALQPFGAPRPGEHAPGEAARAA